MNLKTSNLIFNFSKMTNINRSTSLTIMCNLAATSTCGKYIEDVKMILFELTYTKVLI